MTVWSPHRDAHERGGASVPPRHRRAASCRCSLTVPTLAEVRATFAAPFPRLAGRPELIDGALDDDALVREMLRDLRRVNRWLGGAALSRRALVRLLARTGARAKAAAQATPIRILDVGTGAADIPVELISWGERQGVALEFEAVDSRREIIVQAQREHAAVDGLRLRVADGVSLPYPDGSFDVAHTSLLAHHLEPDELARSLRELRRVSMLGVVVNDLDRTLLGFVGAWVLTRLFTRNRLTRHDGPLSVRRAYRPAELRDIARRAGLLDVALVRGVVGYRYAMSFVADTGADVASTTSATANTSL